MPASVRRDIDLCSGHGGFPPRQSDQGSPNMLVNDQPVVCVGDHWVTHCDSHSCHDSQGSSGSPNVFCNDKPRMRVGDAIACGSTAAHGSPNVLINE